MTTEDWARPVVHWELQARDPDTVSRFYATLFNWNIGDGPVKRVHAGIGAPESGAAGTFRQGSHPGFSLYIQVRDLRASLTKVEELGGRVLSQPFDSPGGQTLAGITDPEGNRVVLVQQ